MIDITGKRILICHSFIYQINGSTMVTLELAEALKEKDCEVVVYTTIADNPAMEAFKEKNIKVVTYDDDPNFKLEDFDVVWIHSQVVPKSLVRDMGRFSEARKTPYFIFLHMSPLDNCSDEKPWIYELEKKISDKTLVIAEATKESTEKILGKQKIDFYRNPAPDKYSKNFKKRKTLKKLLIVSNHCPNEVLEARKTLEERGVKTELLGEGGRYEPMSPELLKEYDAVVTIGKTVQYCLLSGVPVYIYDHWGGSGYLTAENYEKCRKTNFSGRDSNSKKTSDEIAEQIIDGFGEAARFLAEKRAELKQEFSVRIRLESLFHEIKKKKKENFTKDYIVYVEMCQDLARHGLFYGMYDSFRTKRRLGEEIKKLRAEIIEITSARSYRIMVKLLKMIKR